jgi:hypothetical protein
MAGVGVAGEFAVNSATIANDGATDTLRGNGDRDWFWADEEDDVLNSAIDEVLNDWLG